MFDCILHFKQDGDWPWQLSIYPFFAQYRCLYIILAYQRTSKEVDVALSLLFVVGSICLACAYILELNLPLPALVKLAVGRARSLYASLFHETVYSPELRDSSSSSIADDVKFLCRLF